MNEAGEQFAAERQEESSAGENIGTPERVNSDPAAVAAQVIPEAPTDLSTTIQSSTPSSPATQSPDGRSRARRIRHPDETGWLGSLQSVLITVAIAVFVITFIVQAFQIPSESMENTLLIGDYLLVDKAHFGPGGTWSWLIPYQKIRRGDIVVFRYPIDPKQHFVKRVIGTPGDRVRLMNKRLFINGSAVNEPYAIHIKGNYIPFRDNFPNGDMGWEHLEGNWGQQLRRFTEEKELIVPDGFYFVMGDNRDDSSDSRYWGFVPRENIIGRPLVIYWSVNGTERDDPDDEKLQPGGKLTRFAVAMKRGWQDLRWQRVLTLVH